VRFLSNGRVTIITASPLKVKLSGAFTFLRFLSWFVQATRVFSVAVVFFVLRFNPRCAVGRLEDISREALY